MSLVRLERLLLFRQRDCDLVIAISLEGIVMCLIGALAKWKLMRLGSPELKFCWYYVNVRGHCRMAEVRNA